LLGACGKGIAQLGAAFAELRFESRDKHFSPPMCLKEQDADFLIDVLDCALDLLGSFVSSRVERGAS